MLGQNVTGTLEGGNGTNLLILNNFYSNKNAFALIDRKRFLCEKILTPTSILPQCSSQNKVALKKINQIFGQAKRKEVIYIAKDITLVDGKGGENEAFPDIIYVTNESEEGLKVLLRANTEVNYLDSNWAPYPVDYIISSDQQGKAQINFPFRDNIQLRLFFDYFLENITAIDINDYQLRLNISSSQDINFNENFSLTLQNSVTNFSNLSSTNVALPPENVYYFFKEGIQLKILDENHIYAKVESVRTIDELLNSFIMVAKRLKKSFSIQLTGNETVSIGQMQNEILMTNCLAESYLIGNGGENVYAILPLNTTLLPLPEVILYDLYDESAEAIEDLRDTLDLREVVRKINRVCPGQTLFTTFFQEGDDLIISINARYYLVGHECVQSGREWSAAVIRFLKAFPTEWFQKIDILLYDNRPQTIMYEK